MEEIKEEGWVITELRTDMGFTSRLALKPVHEGKRRGIFIVCAGGAFLFKSSNEAKPVAEYFYRAGINVAILDYHVDPAKQKDSDKLDVRISAGEDGLAAIRYLRLHADELGICPDKIAIGGFSAWRPAFRLCSHTVFVWKSAGRGCCGTCFLKAGCRLNPLWRYV